ncbi:MAG TPA: PAS domain-containing protein, partial [bacterium]|nr:PAS domain-containing protein [bacterium]
MPLDFERNPRLLDGLLEDLEHALFSVDARGYITAWNQEATRITGFRRDAVIGRPLAAFDTGTPCLQVLTKWLTEHSEPRHRFEGKLRARGERTVAVRGSARLVRDDDGNVIGAVGAFRELHRPAPPTTTAPTARDAIPGLIGNSEPMLEVARRVRLAAHSDVTVLIQGESGTGKELVARAVHDLSARRERPFVAVNCAALPESMLEAELFGHVQGAFTGAVRDRAGLIESAASGTLFLDEIGDLSPLMQVKLLRVLQEREVRRIGDESSHAVDLRLVTATNRNLRQLLDDGAMREDFYYRIRVYEIAMPPLRDRLGDVPLLVDWFVRQQNEATDRGLRGASQAALRRLLDHPWPGNVRELRNAIEHAFVTADGDWIDEDDLPAEIRTPSPSDGRALGRNPRRGGALSPRDAE